MKARSALLLSVVFVLAPTAVAQAALPSTHNTLIVPAKSLGGVKLGSSIAVATTTWGKGGTCGASSCEYSTKTGGSASILFAATTAGGPEGVVRVSVTAGLLSANSTKHNFKTPLARFKTAKGIGIGSTPKQLTHAYPQLKKTAGIYTLAGPGESFTAFTVLEGRVEGISIQSQHLG